MATNYSYSNFNTFPITVNSLYTVVIEIVDSGKRRLWKSWSNKFMEFCPRNYEILKPESILQFRREGKWGSLLACRKITTTPCTCAEISVDEFEALTPFLVQLMQIFQFTRQLLKIALLFMNLNRFLILQAISHSALPMHLAEETPNRDGKAFKVRPLWA